MQQVGDAELAGVTRAIATLALAQALLAGAALSQQAVPALTPTELGVVYPVLGPLPVVDGPDGLPLPPLAMDFGTPLRVVDERGDFVAVEFPDGEYAWVDSAFVVTAAEGDPALVTGFGFRMSSRPELRAWFSHAGIAGFLGYGLATAGEADLQEHRTGATHFDIRLPVLARDTLPVLTGGRAEVAEILVPVLGAVSESRDRIAGVTGPGYDIRLLVDASPDALGFSSTMMSRLSRDLEAAIRVDTKRNRLFLNRFANPVADWPAGEVTFASLRRPLEGLPVEPTSGTEPLRAALSHEIDRIELGDHLGTLLVVLSGADVGSGTDDEEWLETLGRDPRLTILLAQVTPESDPDLAALADVLGRAFPVAHLPFSPGLSRGVVDEIAKVVRPGAVHSLTRAELDETCAPAAAADLICLLPSLGTSSAYPLSPRSDTDVDWWAARVWVVEDRSIFAPSR